MKCIQFGPIRSGTTLIWNILKEFFPYIKKTHTFPSKKEYKIISTIRDPRDILKSLLIISLSKKKESLTQSSKKITLEMINFEIQKIKKLGLDYLLNNKHHKNILILRYELFHNNYNYIFDNLEKFLNLKISPEKRIEIQNKYNIKNLKKISKEQQHFRNWDKKTLIHGKHISANPEPGSWKEYIPKEYHKYICSSLKKYLIGFNYL